MIVPTTKAHWGKNNTSLTVINELRSKNYKVVTKIADEVGVGQSAIANRISRNPILKKSLGDKINISAINERFI